MSLTPEDEDLYVLIVTPNDTDAALSAEFLHRSGIDSTGYRTLSEVGNFLESRAGCIILVEEALQDSDIQVFQQALAEQPAWSDLPLLLIAGHDTSLAALGQRIFPGAGNITLLQRPLHPVSLTSAVQVAFRARRRQLQVRDLLQQRSEALRQRDEFLAMLAHELRNPLTPVRNAVYMLNQIKTEDPVLVRARHLLDNQVSHMSRLVDDLLDVSRLEIGKVELRAECVDLNMLATAAVDASGGIARAGKHTLHFIASKDPLWIRADPVRVEQVISNLIGNAAKFTPGGGTITLTLSGTHKEALITVQDSGVGIRPDMQEAIFDLFRQADSSLARSSGGLGIGLTVVKRLMALHDGSVSVHSEGIGRGSRFVLRFPRIDQTAVAEPAALPAAAARFAAKRVLIVEDNHDIRESLCMLATLWKHEVFSTGTGNEGVDLAFESKPDVALIDIGLPGLDGYGVARQIRRQNTAWSKRIKLVALTGYGQAADKARAAREGFDLHLVKPVDPLQLEQLLAEL